MCFTQAGQQHTSNKALKPVIEQSYSPEESTIVYQSDFNKNAQTQALNSTQQNKVYVSSTSRKRQYEEILEKTYGSTANKVQKTKD